MKKLFTWGILIIGSLFISQGVFAAVNFIAKPEIATVTSGSSAGTQFIRVPIKTVFDAGKTSETLNIVNVFNIPGSINEDSIPTYIVRKSDGTYSDDSVSNIFGVNNETRMVYARISDLTTSSGGTVYGIGSKPAKIQQGLKYAFHFQQQLSGSTVSKSETVYIQWQPDGKVRIVPPTTPNTSPNGTTPPINTGTTPPINTGTTPSSLSTGNSVITLKNPLKFDSIPAILGAIVTNIVLPIAVPIFIIMLIYCGVKFVLARGNPEALKQARESLKWTLIGGAVILGAYAIAELVAGTIGAVVGK